MDFDQRARETAARMLAPKASGGKGQVVTIRAATHAGYAPATGAASVGSTAFQTGSGIEEAYKSREIDGTTIKAGDKRLMLSPLNSTGGDMTLPAPGDLLQYASGQKWRIIAVEPYAPAGLWVYAYLHLRGV